MKKQNIVSITATVFGLVLFCQAGPIMAYGPLFDKECKTCHEKAGYKTCAGCHAHGTHSSVLKNDINLRAYTDKPNYQPGESMSISVEGGYRAGWVRVYLFNNPNAEGTPIAKSTGPDGMGGGPAMPIIFELQAPTEPGMYTYSASWYGNARDKTNPTFGKWRQSTNLNHGEEIVPTNPFTVGNVESELPPEASAAGVIQR